MNEILKRIRRSYNVFCIIMIVAICICLVRVGYLIYDSNLRDIAEFISITSLIIVNVIVFCVFKKSMKYINELLENKKGIKVHDDEIIENTRHENNDYIDSVEKLGKIIKYVKICAIICCCISFALLICGIFMVNILPWKYAAGSINLGIVSICSTVAYLLLNKYMKILNKVYEKAKQKFKIF